MSKFSSLVLLINSLSKGEKRYFKLYSNLQQGTKDYLRLFNEIQKGLSLNEAKKAYSQKQLDSSFDVTCNYLYKLLLNALLHVRTEKDINIKLNIEILKIPILFEKGLYEDGFKSLKNIQFVAEKSELPTIHLRAAALELHYINSLSFHTIAEEGLINKQMKLQGLLKSSQHTFQHHSLYQLLHHRLIYKGNVRTKEQKQELNDLLITELGLLSKSFAENFESKKTHYLFQSYYFMSIGNYSSALKTFYELNQLFEERSQVFEGTEIDYLLTIEGILDSLKSIKRYDEMHFFIEKLKQQKSIGNHYEINRRRIIYIYITIGYLEKGNFGDAKLLIEQNKTILFEKLNLLELSKQAEVYMYTALIYLVEGNLEKAHITLNEILLESKLYYTLPVYRTFRLIRLMVHFEMGNHDYIKHEIRSIKRTLSGSNHQTYLLEKLMFKFLIQDNLPTLFKEKTALWNKTKKAFDKLKTDKYEIQVLNIFNFDAWTEGQLFKKPLATILKEKYEEDYPF
ncbi:hypothetical protein ACFOWA_17835 [Pedobacter lithocola]|uniref:Tetratricopeptide repeat protein n=1 Tax=Pedobacter lithocola TaxID=1908239 RepID=A0ABV8PH70_9SPHI